MIKIDLDVEPVSWMPSRVINRLGFAYNPRGADKRATQYLVAEQYKGPILKDTCHVWFEFHFKPPASASQKKRAQMFADLIIPTKKDCTNLQKFYEDCLKGIVIEDDRNVQSVGSVKKYAIKNRVQIFIYAKGDNYEEEIERIRESRKSNS